MKISVVMVFGNELEFLPGWIKSVKKYADEIICACHHATDGSREYMEWAAKNINIPIKIQYFSDPYTVYKYGFSFMKNAVLEKATGDWVICLDADEEMTIKKNDFLPFNGGRDVCIFSALMQTWSQNKRWISNNEVVRPLMKKEAEWENRGETCTTRILRNGLGIRWSGLIHERPILPDGHLVSPTRKTKIKMWHYGSMGDPRKRSFKDGLYAELVCRLVEKPELRGATHEYWWQYYYPENKRQLIKERKQFRETLRKSGVRIIK